jgi:hypothetical protein
VPDGPLRVECFYGIKTIVGVPDSSRVDREIPQAPEDVHEMGSRFLSRRTFEDTAVRRERVRAKHQYACSDAK